MISEQVEPQKNGAAAPPHRPSQAQKDEIDSKLIIWSVLFSIADFIQHTANGNIQVMMIGSYHFYFNDLAVALLGIVILRNIGRLRPTHFAAWWALAFCAVAAIGLIRGLGVNAFLAVFSFRGIATLPAFLLLFVVMRLPSVHLAMFRRPLLLGMLCVFAIFLSRQIFGPGFLVRDPGVFLDPEFENGRALDALSAIFLGCAVLYFVHMWLIEPDKEKRKLSGYLAVLGIVVEILSRQRTASAATIVGMIAYTAFVPGLIQKLPTWIKATLITIGIGVICVAAFGLSDKVLDMLPERFQQSWTSTGTFEGRTLFWQAAIDEFRKRDLIDQLTGIYAGKPILLLTSTGQIWQTSLHNQGIQTLNNFGIAGVICLAMIIFGSVYAAFKALRRRELTNAVGLSPALALSWVVSMTVFGISYEWAGIANLFVPLACASWKSPLPTLQVSRRRAKPKRKSGSLLQFKIKPAKA